LALLAVGFGHRGNSGDSVRACLFNAMPLPLVTDAPASAPIAPPAGQRHNGQHLLVPPLPGDGLQLRTPSPRRPPYDEDPLQPPCGISGLRLEGVEGGIIALESRVDSSASLAFLGPSASQSGIRYVGSSNSLLEPATSTASSLGLPLAGSVRSYTPSDAGTGTFSSLSLSTPLVPPAELSSALPSFPKCFRCPINQEIMMDPVFTVDGVTYERENIVAYFSSGRRTSPATGLDLASLELVPNEALREAIESYKDLHSGAEHLQREWESYTTHQGHRATQKLLHRQRQVRVLKSALEQSDRRIQALETSAGLAAKPASNAPSGTDSTADGSSEGASRGRTPSEFSPTATAEPMFKSGPAPRADRAASRSGARRRKVLCRGRLLPSVPAAKGGA